MARYTSPPRQRQHRKSWVKGQDEGGGEGWWGKVNKDYIFKFLDHYLCKPMKKESET